MDTDHIRHLREIIFSPVSYDPLFLKNEVLIFSVKLKRPFLKEMDPSLSEKDASGHMTLESLTSETLHSMVVERV